MLREQGASRTNVRQSSPACTTSLVPFVGGPGQVEGKLVRRTATVEMLRKMTGDSTIQQGRNDSYIDTLFDHAGFLRENEFIGVIPRHLIGTEVAIVGGGVSGIATAYELHKIGLRPVLFELTGRLNGRLESRHFHDPDGKEVAAFADIGAMRIPLSSRVTWHYANKVGIRSGRKAPVTGSVPAKLYFDGKVIDWPAGAKYPDHPLIRQLSIDWDHFFDSELAKVREATRRDDPEARRAAWQDLISRYKDATVYNVIRGIKSSTTGKPFGQEEIEMLGAMGTGIGGIAPLFSVNFLDFLRQSVDKLDEDLYGLPEGAESLPAKLYEHEVERFDGSKSSLKNSMEVHLDCRVTGTRFDPVTGTHSLQVLDRGRPISTRPFQAVVTTAAPPCLQMMHLGMEPEPDAEDSPRLFSGRVRRAIDGSSMASSSKLFIRTRTKFWIGKNDLPQVIYGSQGVKSVYCIDQEATSNGVICLDYSWGKDSNKMLAWSPRERFEMIREGIRRMDPRSGSWAMQFADELEPMPGADGEPEFISVDWQAEKRSLGAFKATEPGQDPHYQALAFQYLSVNASDSQPDSGLYLGGDGADWPSGWIEGGLHKSLETACAAIQRVGGKPADGSPLTEQDKDLYDYF